MSIYCDNPEWKSLRDAPTVGNDTGGMKGMGLFHVITSIGLAVQLLAGSAPADSAAPCAFVLGFKVLHDSIPEVVGDCLENERDFPAGGAEQTTAQGTLRYIVLSSGEPITVLQPNSDYGYALSTH